MAASEFSNDPAWQNIAPPWPWTISEILLANSLGEVKNAFILFLIAIVFFNNQIFISFLLWNYMSSLCILNIDLLSDMWFANIFSYSVVRLFIPLSLLLCRSFLDWCNSIYLFLLLLLVLLVSYRKSLSDQRQEVYPYASFWKCFIFILCLNL